MHQIILVSHPCLLIQVLSLEQNFPVVATDLRIQPEIRQTIRLLALFHLKLENTVSYLSYNYFECESYMDLCY